MVSKILQAHCWVLWGVSGIVFWGLIIYWFYHWMGFLGLIIGLFVGLPFEVVFPFVYWAVEGFSLGVFGLWAFVLATWFLANRFSDSNDKM